MNKQIDSIRRRLGATVKVWVLVVAVAGGVIFGGLVHSLLAPGEPEREAVAAGRQMWTCSMHPQIRLPAPGLCPICPMELIPVDVDTDEVGTLRELTVSEAARKLMGIRTWPVERRFVEARVRMGGEIDYDETLVKHITAWVPGRIDRLHVHYSGVAVRAGEHMVDLYSPDLLIAQEELLQAIAAVRELEDSDIGIVREMTEATVLAVREKLRLWGLLDEQIAAIERRGEASDRVTIHAPIGGIVVAADAQEGTYVQTGTRLYTIADLTQVWAKLDAYESDLQWLRLGQAVELTTDAYPGEAFTGRISLIDPVLTARTRTIKLRVIAANAEMMLKPGMFVRAVVRAKVAAGGKVMDDALVGKWMCSMHPEVVREVAGDCDVCGMPLVRAESLGYVGVGADQADPPLVIPVTAALITGGRSAGSRAIVYVQVDPSLLTLRGVIDWPALLTTARAAADSARVGPTARLWRLLSDDLRDGLLAVGPNEMPPAPLQHRFVREINAILRGDALHDASAWRGVALGEEAAGLIARGTADLPADDLTRLNRLLLEATFPTAITSARSGPTFQGREVLLGPRAGDYYIVRRGLADGERVVTEGNFKIDAELQIRAQPAMMTPTGGGSGGGHHHHGGEVTGDGEQMAAMDMSVQVPAAVRRQLQAVLAAAEGAERAVRADDLADARAAFAALAKAVGDVPSDELTGRADLLWREHGMLLANDGADGAAAETIQQATNVAELVGEHAAAMAAALGVSPVRTAMVAAAIDREFREQFGRVVRGYLLVQQALANDDVAGAQSAAGVALAAVEAADMNLLTGQAHVSWMDAADQMTQILADIVAAEDIQRAREDFSLLSEQLAATVSQLGGAPAGALHQFRCPMAFDSRGAMWLQSDDQTRNPYFGAVMPKCGSVTDVLPAAPDGGGADE